MIRELVYGMDQNMTGKEWSEFKLQLIDSLTKAKKLHQLNRHELPLSLLTLLEMKSSSVLRP